MRVLVAAGGTAGHILPALALAEWLSADGDDVRFVGTAQGQEARLIPAAGFSLSIVDARPFPRRPTPELLLAGSVALRSIAACRPLVRAADVVVGMGGYVSVPAGVAAAMSRVPLVLHEQNAVPGLANRLLARRAAVVALSYTDTEGRFPRSVPTRVTGNPVRSAVVSMAQERISDPEGSRSRAAAALGLRSDLPTVVVFGGSLGATRLNTAAIAAAGELNDVQFLLLAGKAHADRVRDSVPAGSTMRVEGFIDHMELAYAAADLVVARAGATTCAELAVNGIPALLIPYPYATADHQAANAAALRLVGGADVIADDRLGGTMLAQAIRGMLDDRERLAAMGRAMRGAAHPDAAAALADLVRSVA